MAKPPHPRASNAAPGTESGDGLKGRACVACASRRPARMSASILLPWCLLRQRAVHNLLIFFPRPQGPSPYGTKLTSDIGQSSRAPGYAASTFLEPTTVASPGRAATVAVARAKINATKFKRACFGFPFVCGSPEVNPPPCRAFGWQGFKTPDRQGSKGSWRQHSMVCRVLVC